MFMSRVRSRRSGILTTILTILGAEETLQTKAIERCKRRAGHWVLGRHGEGGNSLSNLYVFDAV